MARKLLNNALTGCCNHAAAGDEQDTRGKGRKAVARKAKPEKPVGGVLPDFLLPDVASVDAESEVGCRTPVIPASHRTCCLTAAGCALLQDPDSIGDRVCSESASG